MSWCPSPLTPAHIRAFDRATALNDMAGTLILHGYTFEAAIHLLQAAAQDISPEAQAVLRQRADELLVALCCRVWGLDGEMVSH